MVASNWNLTVAGALVTIRPIRATDVDLEAAFIRRLSPQTKRYRFFGGIRELSPSQLKNFCEVDGCHSMAFVATVQKEGVETEIGVARYAPNSKADIREMAVTISDEWQHTGVGQSLVRQLCASAKAYGVTQVYSIDLAVNTTMRDMAHELGMSAKRDPDDSQQVIYSLEL